MLHDQEAVVVLLQNGHELEGGEGPAHVKLGDVPVQPAEHSLGQQIRLLLSLNRENLSQK